MESVDEQLRQLRGAYERMTDEELCAVAEDANDLTPIARQALQAIISDRHLAIQLKTVIASLDDQGVPAPDKNGLVYLCPVWSEEEARNVQDLLKTESIPSYLGPDNVRRVEDFKRFFDTGVDVKVAAADQDRAMALLTPDETEEEDSKEEEGNPWETGEGYVVTCPKCQSLEVDIYDPPQVPPDDATIPWRCNVCGHKWKTTMVER